MVAGLPGNGVTSLDAPFCTVTIALGDVMEETSFLKKSVAAGDRRPVSFSGTGPALCC